MPRRASEEMRPRGTVSWLPLSPMQGAVGSFRAVVAMQPCLFKESLAESRSAPAAGPVATPKHLPRQEARSSGLRGWGRARAGQAWGCSVPAFLDPLAALSVERSWKLDSSGDRSLASGWRSER